MVKSSRIHSWFIGYMNNEEVHFKFTYSWNLEKQVKIKTSKGIISTSLDFFNSNVKPLKGITNIFVEAH